MSGQSGRDALERWQQRLLRALWADTHDNAQQVLTQDGEVPANGPAQEITWRGLAAYRSHATALATRVLGQAYPVATQMLGDANLAGLARSLWRAHPPSQGDMGKWGGALADHIESIAELSRAEPYLADLARLEWALHEMHAFEDMESSPASFDRLAEMDPGDLLLQLAPGTGSLASRWPIVTLYQAHQSEPPALSIAARALDAGAAETAVYWRQGWRPRVRQALLGEESFLRCLLAGASLEVALDRARGFDFGAWLLPAAQEGLLLRVERRPAVSGPPSR